MHTRIRCFLKDCCTAAALNLALLSSSFAAETPSSLGGLPVVRDFAASLPVKVSPFNHSIRYTGRFDATAPGGPRCDWSASSVALSFTGRDLNVRLEESSSDDLYEIVVDGKASAILSPQSGNHLYRVFSAIRSATHTIVLVKRTEAFVGTTQFLGFELAAGGKLPPPAPSPARRLEVIGDSISCGYGNEAHAKEEHFTPATENAYLTYGSITAQALGAEYVCTAWSGRTMWPDNTMPEIYDRTIAIEPNSRWDFTKWIPQAVVINLGTNDFRKAAPDQQSWTGAYEAFIAHVRQHYSRALIYCATSPMMFGDSYNTELRYLKQIVQDRHTAGDTRVRLLLVPTQDAKNGYGADWHPSIKTHRIMAAQLEKALRHDLGWETSGSSR